MSSEWHISWVLQTTSIFRARASHLVDKDLEKAIAFGEASVRKGAKAWGKTGVAIAQMHSYPRPAFYTGEIFDSNVATVIPTDPNSSFANLVLSVNHLSTSEAVRLIDKA